MKLFIAIATILTVSGQIYGQEEQLENSIYSDVNVIFYGTSTSDTISFRKGQEPTFTALSTTYFDPAKPTKVHIHGWSESPESESTLTVINAYLTRKSEFNIALVNWSSISTTRTVFLVPYEVHFVALQAYSVIGGLATYGFNPAQTHISGFSFGVTIAGYIGRTFKRLNGITIPRITALDPPNLYRTFDPLYLINIITRINRNDAAFVDVIHTNYDQVGDKPSRGHVDFWPNGGTIQPACQIFTFDAFKIGINASANFANVGCSHHRAWRYYAESVIREPTPSPFVAKKCPATATTFTTTNCNTASTISMGYYAQATATGLVANSNNNFRVTTNSASPFSQS